MKKLLTTLSILFIATGASLSVASSQDSDGIKVHKSYYANGKVFEETYYQDEVKNKIKVYDGSGNLMVIKEFDEGELVSFNHYYVNGILRTKRVFENGELLSKTRFDPEGNVIPIIDKEDGLIYNYDYDEWGRILYEGVKKGKSWEDGELFRSRWYDENGELIQEEVYGDSGESKKDKVGANTNIYTVERVIDGDTLKLTNGERVRLIGIDTPESRDNPKARRDAERTGQDLETITKMGQEATEFVKGLVKQGQEVRLDFDVQGMDKYGRLLAYVYIPEVLWKSGEQHVPISVPPTGHERVILDDGNTVGAYKFLNATIIKSGYAQPMTIPPNVKYAELFERLYKEAREQKRGLWKEYFWDEKDGQVIFGRFLTTEEVEDFHEKYMKDKGIGIRKFNKSEGE